LRKSFRKRFSKVSERTSIIALETALDISLETVLAAASEIA
jgi:hypothetical protein